MADLDLWHKNEKLYKREALGVDPTDDNIKELPGMIFRSRRDMPAAPMTYLTFREVYAKWHNTLTSVSHDSPHTIRAKLARMLTFP